MDETKRGRGDATWLLALSGMAVVAAILLALRGSDAYRSILGVTRPIAATVVVAALGLIGWKRLVACSWVPDRNGGLGFGVAAAVGLTLPALVIVVDVLGGFERDINVAFPDSLLFYPAVALLAEIAFHVVPLALAAQVARHVDVTARQAEVIGIILAVAGEPTLQVLWGAEGSPRWANAYVGVHLLAFNVVGVHILRRHGVLAVYLYRLSYYVVWHVAWGYLRLGLLFQT